MSENPESEPSIDELTDLLKEVKKLVINEQLSDIEKGMLKEELNSFITHEHGLDRETTSCLFWGWWVRNNLRESGIDIDNPVATTAELPEDSR